MTLGIIIAANQEKFYFQNSRYGTLAELGSPTTENDWYTLSVSDNDLNGYSATATAKSAGPQFADENCRQFELRSTGNRLAFNAANGSRDDCWR